tara:strand:- start:26522 stop:27601 length:1080 start_codon:yes stop_codon:yes gene_type:complete
MIFKKSVIGKSIAAANQWDEVQFHRNAANAQEQMFINSGQMMVDPAKRALSANDGFIPRDLYQEFDNVTVEAMLADQGDVFLNDLLPLSRSVSLGTQVHNFRMASDSGLVQTSMSGQIGVKMDQVEYTYDGFIVPISDAGFSRNFREKETFTSSGFDALIDDQRETMRSVRADIADQFLNGHKDKNGQLIVVDGKSWAGMRTDTHVAQVDLGAGGVNFDFTDTTKTYAEIEAALKEVRDVLWITNNCELDATYYVSRQIASNFERASSESYNSEKILERLGSLQGIAGLKASSKLTGNEFMAFPLDANKVRPLVGMGMNTVAMPRPVYNSNYEFVIWGAIGFEVRNDFSGKTCALFAQA